ncbi:hypothetical protein [Mesorhizobium sp. ANAO-SY3R2]|uniref:hypothetical protein n=1 Tax=Mesorhizobium sp. ANAO-SY3R2 TaxID=3166644 RepID=UPI00366B0ACC
MSIMGSIGRYGAAIRKAHRNARSIRHLNSLPPEIQKDIGWPVENDARARSLYSTVLPGH